MAGTYAKYSPISGGGGGGGGGGITSINGDTTAAQVIAGGTGITVATTGGTTTITSSGSTGANTALSNLTSPTAINQNLLFGTDNTYSIGSAGASRPNNIYVANTVVVGGATISALGTDNFFVNGGNATLTGTHNVGILSGALSAVTDGSNLIAIGHNALHVAASEANAIDGHIAIGTSALAAYISDSGAPLGGGDGMVAIGSNALHNTTTSDGSVAIGHNAGGNYVAASYYNVHVGSYAGAGNTGGSYNTSVGYNALSNNSGTYTGSGNSVFGDNALGALGPSSTTSNNVVFGYNAAQQQFQYNNSVYVGAQADATVTALTNTIAVGYQARVGISNFAQIGNTSLVGMGFSGYEDRTQIATPASPAANHDRLYFKSDNNLYQLNSSGVEVQVSGLAAGGVTSFTGDGTLINNVASTGAVTASLASAPAYTSLSNSTGSSAAPTYNFGTIGFQVTGTSLTLTSSSPSYISFSAVATATLPSAATCIGKVFVFASSNAGTATVTAPSGDAIYYYASASVPSWSIQSLTTLTLISTAAGHWQMLNSPGPLYPSSGSVGALGSIGYNSNGNFVWTAAGTAGQVLKSNGSTAPTWITLAGSSSLKAPTKQILSGSGTYTTPSSPSPLYITVSMVGPGGAGGGASTASSTASAGQGGSSGAYLFATITAPSATYAYSVGTGGTPGTAGNNPGNAGSGATTFGTSLLSAGAGAGGAGSGTSTTPAATGGVGNNAAATGGDINIPGGYGRPGLIFAISQAIGGAGAASYLSNSAGASGSTSTGAGSTGLNYGGGGSGGVQVSGGAAQAGGAGAPGTIIVNEYYQ
jgi:hypothetical protein